MSGPTTPDKGIDQEFMNQFVAELKAMELTPDEEKAIRETFAKDQDELKEKQPKLAQAQTDTGKEAMLQARLTRKLNNKRKEAIYKEFSNKERVIEAAAGLDAEPEIQALFYEIIRYFEKMAVSMGKFENRRQELSMQIRQLALAYGAPLNDDPTSQNEFNETTAAMAHATAKAVTVANFLRKSRQVGTGKLNPDEAAYDRTWNFLGAHQFNQLSQNESLRATPNEGEAMLAQAFSPNPYSTEATQKLSARIQSPAGKTHIEALRDNTDRLTSIINDMARTPKRRAIIKHQLTNIWAQTTQQGDAEANGTIRTMEKLSLPFNKTVFHADEARNFPPASLELQFAVEAKLMDAIRGFTVIRATDNQPAAADYGQLQTVLYTLVCAAILEEKAAKNDKSSSKEAIQNTFIRVFGASIPTNNKPRPLDETDYRSFLLSESAPSRFDTTQLGKFIGKVIGRNLACIATLVGEFMDEDTRAYLFQQLNRYLAVGGENRRLLFDEEKGPYISEATPNKQQEAMNRAAAWYYVEGKKSRVATDELKAQRLAEVKAKDAEAKMKEATLKREQNDISTKSAAIYDQLDYIFRISFTPIIETRAKMKECSDHLQQQFAKIFDFCDKVRPILAETSTLFKKDNVSDGRTLPEANPIHKIHEKLAYPKPERGSQTVKITEQEVDVILVKLYETFRYVIYHLENQMNIIQKDPFSGRLIADYQKLCKKFKELQTEFTGTLGVLLEPSGNTVKKKIPEHGETISELLTKHTRKLKESEVLAISALEKLDNDVEALQIAEAEATVFKPAKLVGQNSLGAVEANALRPIIEQINKIEALYPVNNVPRDSQLKLGDTEPLTLARLQSRNFNYLFERLNEIRKRIELAQAA